MESAQTTVNWADFDIEDADRLKIESGRKYEIGFYSVKQDSIEVVDKEKTVEGKLEVKKTIPVLVLGIDFYEGKSCKRELMVSSKKLAKSIRTYFEKGMLFSRMFELEKSGSGFQTAYSLLALGDKPAGVKAPVEAYM